MDIITKVLFKNDAIHLITESGAAFDLPLTIEYSNRYKAGDELSDEEKADLRQISEGYRCRIKALVYCSRAKSVKQVRDYLLKKEFSVPAVDGAIDYLVERSYLDDEAYAEEYLLSMMNRKVVGRKYAEHKLLQKGIEREIISRTVEKHPELFDYDQKLYDLAVSRFEKIGEKPNSYEKIARFLASRGFETDKVFAVLNQMRREGYKFKTGGD